MIRSTADRAPDNAMGAIVDLAIDWVCQNHREVFDFLPLDARFLQVLENMLGNPLEVGFLKDVEIVIFNHFDDREVDLGLRFLVGLSTHPCLLF